jgi:hypothetical protein
LVVRYLGSFLREELKIKIKIGTRELDFSQAFREHQARSIPTPYEPEVNFCSKSPENAIFFNFRGAFT